VFDVDATDTGPDDDGRIELAVQPRQRAAAAVRERGST
jgi:hypothetical protein